MEQRLKSPHVACFLAILQVQTDLPEGASVPALGLSNKAVYKGEPQVPEEGGDGKSNNNQYQESYFTAP
jgi:hypothetical protein